MRFAPMADTCFQRFLLLKLVMYAAPVCSLYYYYVCVYLDRQIALPIWGATHVFFFFFFFNICISFSIFVILVDVFFSFLVSFSNMSFVVILVEGSLCIPGHVSRTCSCVSIFSGHFRHFVSLYLPLKLFFTSNILVLALNIIDASWRVNSFMYLGRSPTFHLVFFSKYCVFVFPSQVFSIFSWRNYLVGLSLFLLCLFLVWFFLYFLLFCW